MTAITHYITNDYKAIDGQETVANVQDFLLESNFSHFPILENDVYIGNIVAQDVETFDSQMHVLDYKYSLEVFFVSFPSLK